MLSVAGHKYVYIRSISSSCLAVNLPFLDPLLSGPGIPSSTFFVNLKRTITLSELVYDHDFGYALRKGSFSHYAWGQVNMVFVHPIIWYSVGTPSSYSKRGWPTM